MQNKNYFVGLDIGTDSVGYAVCNTDYSLCKFHSEPMWGSTLFSSAEQSSDRRGFRTARRRLDRRQQRIVLLKEIFTEEIEKIDSRFYTRLEESALFAEDKTYVTDKNTIFNDSDFKDKDYHKKYPTIHHLICDLMKSHEAHDVRLVYLACAWLIAHRGHFLTEMDITHIGTEHMFEETYRELTAYVTDCGYRQLWVCEPDALEKILCTNQKCGDKQKSLMKLLNNGKKFVTDDSESYLCDRNVLVKLLAGSKVSPADLFLNKTSYGELDSITLGKDIEKFEKILPSLSDSDAEFLRILQKLTDCVTLTELLGSHTCISEAKVSVYEQHKADLKNLKDFIKKYCPEKYKEIFNKTEGKLKNYAAYAYHYNTISGWQLNPPESKAKKEDFSAYLKKIVSQVHPNSEDQDFYADMMSRLENSTFLPKQVDTENRVIPYQLYLYELQVILDNASAYMPWLMMQDEDGLSPKEKILSIFTFRVPYFVGPLCSANNEHAWIQRKAGKIYPWNFETQVDLDVCEDKFIHQMTNKCTYLPNEDVLPRYSLLYSKYTALNEINNIKINGEPISVDQKQSIYENCVLKKQRLTKNAIKKYCVGNGFMHEDDILDGVDETLTSSMKSYFDFRSLMERKVLTEEEVEEIIARSTCMEDDGRYQKWLENHFPHLSSDDLKYVAGKRYKDFGRLSSKLLNGITGCDKQETSEQGTIIAYLWKTNRNLMQLLSDDFTFGKQIEEIRKDYYQEHPTSLNDRLDEMYVPNAVKRPIIRTLDIMREVVHAKGYPPQRIFVEMARSHEEKNKRTVPRKEQILNLYKNVKEDTAQLRKELEEMGESAESRLQDKDLYLYYLQLGRCLYSGEPITLGNGQFNIDHIYPQQYVKDDSILNNLVLVKSTLNGEKEAKYPIDPKIQAKMRPFWDRLLKYGLMTEEKYRRLTRTTGFSDQEKYGFINRQIVETRQSTKAVTTLLSELYPNTEIVYVKAGLVSEFRHTYDLTKCRCLNDLHHAKDAYLNIVVGNVYHCKFTKNFWVDQQYSMKTDRIFAYDVASDNGKAWDAKESLPFVKKTYAKNCIHLTQYAFCRKGGLFDQMPLKAAASDALTPRKKNLPVEKYGGYNKKTASFFILVQYPTKKDATEITILPVDLMIADKFVSDEAYAKEYCKETLNKIYNKNVTEVSFPLGMRILKINTVFEADGFQMCLSGKDGEKILFASNESMVLREEQIRYLKKLESYISKIQEGKNIELNAKYDGITCEANIKLYNILLEKMQNTILQKLPGLPIKTVQNGQSKFTNLSLSEQIKCIMQLVLLCKTGRSGRCDLTYIDGTKNAGSITRSAHLSNWKTYYSDVRVVDTSAAGLYVSKSRNLLELL